MVINDNKLKSLTVSQLSIKHNAILEGEIDHTNFQTIRNYETHKKLNKEIDESLYMPISTKKHSYLDCNNTFDEDMVSREIQSIVTPESEYIKNPLTSTCRMSFFRRIRQYINPFEIPETSEECSYRESFLKKHLVFKKTLDVIKSSLSVENGIERSDIPLIDFESVENFTKSDLTALATPGAQKKKHQFLTSVCPDYKNLPSLKEYNASLDILSEKVGKPVELTESLVEGVAETVQHGSETFAVLERSISASRWIKPAKLLADPDFNLSAKQLAEVFNTLDDTTAFNVIFSFTKQSERFALVTLEPYLYKVLGPSQFFKYFPVLHKPGMLILLLSVTKGNLIKPALFEQSSFSFFSSILSINPSLDLLLNNAIPLGVLSFTTSVLLQYGKRFWQNNIKGDDTKSSVEEILEQNLVDGGFNYAFINAAKIFTGKVGHEFCGILGIFTTSFLQGFLYEHKETLRIVAKKVDSKLESLNDD
jgi:hypothetical protein